MRLIEDIHGMPVEARVEAFEELIRDTSPGIRSQTLRIGAAILCDERLAAYLRDDSDAVLRNAGLEILKLRGPRAFALAVDLLDDPNPDVVLQAALILDHLKDPRALEPLREVLDHSDVNVVQEVILAVGHLGDSRAVEDLIPFVQGDPWLQMAAVEALGDLRSPKAAPPLSALLTDLMLGPLAADSLARIGGAQCYRLLARHWLRFEADLDAETLLGLLAHVVEGLPRVPSSLQGLRSSLSRRLDGAEAVALAAARCLLALGPGPEDGRCLDSLAGAERDRASLPPCLRLRGDLAAELLSRTGRQQGWGFLLTARFSASAPTELLIKVLAELESPRLLPAAVKCLKEVEDPALDLPAVDLYARLPLAERRILAPVLEGRKDRLGAVIADHPGITPETRLVLVALAGGDAEEVAGKILGLPPERRVNVVAQLFDRDDILRRLPWGDWLGEDPERYLPLAADAAVGTEMHDLVPLLDDLVLRFPVPEVIRALGHLGSQETVPVLVKILRRQPDLRPLILESLGEIGGAEAREALRRETGAEDKSVARLAYRALALCATADDEDLFLEATSHPDWNVRLACAEVLGRSSRAENLAALSQLVADPVAIVSQRAASYLDS